MLTFILAPEIREYTNMTTDWKDYQEEAADLFRSMDLDAATVKAVVSERHRPFVEASISHFRAMAEGKVL